jgi:uncharacterized protein with PQ loop repeat
MIETSNFLPFLFIMNSIFLLFLIFNQNDSAKDSVTTQNSTSLENPFEKITWISFSFQFVILLIKIKTTDF